MCVTLAINCNIVSIARMFYERIGQKPPSDEELLDILRQAIVNSQKKRYHGDKGIEVLSPEGIFGTSRSSQNWYCFRAWLFAYSYVRQQPVKCTKYPFGNQDKMSGCLLIGLAKKFDWSKILTMHDYSGTTKPDWIPIFFCLFQSLRNNVWELYGLYKRWWPLITVSMMMRTSGRSSVRLAFASL